MIRENKSLSIILMGCLLLASMASYAYRRIPSEEILSFETWFPIGCAMICVVLLLLMLRQSIKDIEGEATRALLDLSIVWVSVITVLYFISSAVFWINGL